MNTEKFTRTLQIFQLLIDNTSLSIDEIAERTGISRRTAYRYIEGFLDAGFEVTKHKNVFSITLQHPFFDTIGSRLKLSNSELQAIAQLIAEAHSNNPAIPHLKYRLSQLYGLQFDDKTPQLNPHLYDNINTLQTAIRQRRKVILHSYFSPQRQSTTDRLVEPFHIINTTNDIRCYELASDTCKTFKLSRIQGKVEILPEKWTATTRHITYYTDIFGFSGETIHRVTLRLGSLATRILIEEFGVSETQMIIDSDGHHRLITLSVCNYQGIGRFVLGLINDIQIVRGTDFAKYLQKTINESITNINPTPLLSPVKEG